MRFYDSRSLFVGDISLWIGALIDNLLLESYDGNDIFCSYSIYHGLQSRWNEDLELIQSI